MLHLVRLLSGKLSCQTQLFHQKTLRSHIAIVQALTIVLPLRVNWIGP